MQRKIWMMMAVMTLAAVSAMAAKPVTQTPAWDPSRYDVIWDSPSKDARGSMPIGNGSLAANVWVTADGTIHALLARTDSWTEINRLGKVGLVHFKCPALAAAMKDGFTQRLNLGSGLMEITAGKTGKVKLWVWINAHAPVLDITSNLPAAGSMTATIERCRKERKVYAKQTCSDMYDRVPKAPAMWIEPDELLTLKGAVGLAHHNRTSLGPKLTYDHQGLDDAPAAAKSDPLIGRTFGLIVRSEDATKKNSHTLESADRKKHHFRVCADTLQPTTIAKWTANMAALAKSVESKPKWMQAIAHRNYWQAFWKRSYINFTPGKAAPKTPASVLPGKIAPAGNPIVMTPDDAYILSRAYALQRYVTACSGRGAYPLKFNGQIVTVGKPGEDWDYRRWGPGYWWQNTRLPYISMCAAGDFEMMKPLFKMYSDMLPLLKFRTRKYYGHNGAYLSECTYPWGATYMATYGRSYASRKPAEEKVQDVGWHKYEWVAGLELAAFMLDYYEHTGDETFLREMALPMLDAVLTFFNEHYPKRDANGKMVMNPSQALEMWWNCTNPMPEIAGVRSLLRRVKRIDAKLLPAKFQTMCASLGKIIPPIPTRKFGDKIALAPADSFAKRRNREAPQMYALYPFKLYGPGRASNDWALVALRNRLYKNDFGWAQDDMWMACLGLGDEARDRLVKRAKGVEGGYRFPAMWQKNFDWVPDQDHGGVLTGATQMMLLQTDGKTIYLAPAMPGDWNATFKLNAPYNTTIEGVVENGTIKSYTVTPKLRRKDVVLRAAK
jgi:alpha-L-fucosidase 2